ncbi:hypothetical protein [Streptomyces coeruleorubidus]|uniref:Uncharacterized protein n=1 Tax=Streptomyces coeruleorubidus TaxID=116188 RepID=A0ABZ0KNG8_STRC4|nr:MULTISPECIES: hypothetical protein [Streptomyces]WOT39594.1 hypothetical protein R5U08_38155 [Streptomyces coeruleorubidus]GGU42314.1 hypothetical protein GCM10010244_80670 [Streptomyces bellus]
MKYDVLQILGVALLVLGGQGAIRQLVDHNNAGLLGWLPGGFAASITVFLVAVAIGAVVAGRARGKAKEVGRRS